MGEFLLEPSYCAALTSEARFLCWRLSKASCSDLILQVFWTLVLQYAAIFHQEKQILVKGEDSGGERNKLWWPQMMMRAQIQATEICKVMQTDWFVLEYKMLAVTSTFVAAPFIGANKLNGSKLHTVITDWSFKKTTSAKFTWVNIG